jgi:hypothetical protein
MAQRIITPQGWLFIPGVYKMLTATDVLNRALVEAAEFQGMDQNRIDIATGLSKPLSVSDFNKAVYDLRQLQHEFRIEAQSHGILLPMSHIYEEGQFNVQPENCHTDKLKLLVTGLQRSLADMVDTTEAVLKLHNFKL